MATTMASRKKKDRQTLKKRLQQRKQRRLRRGLPSDATVLVEPPGAAKMSEVLMEFLEPYAEHWNNEEELHKLLTVALVAWNAALYSGKERTEFVEKMVAAVLPEARPELRAIVEEMIQRKEAHFAGIRRMIIDYKITTTPTGPHLAVISTPNMG
jgi:hypothetical protein